MTGHNPDCVDPSDEMPADSKSPFITSLKTVSDEKRGLSSVVFYERFQLPRQTRRAARVHHKQLEDARQDDDTRDR